jgi:hypothetical protein
MSSQPNARPDPLDGLTRALKAAAKALSNLDDVYRDDPSLPEYRELLQGKVREFRARICRLLERN